MPRRVYVDMEALLDAIDTHDEGVAFVLDLETGSVELDAVGDGDGDEDGDGGDPERFRDVPQREGREGYEVMRAFAEQLEEEDVRGQLFIALEGRGAFSRFRGVLGRHPDLHARCEERRRESLLAYALEWLRDLDIEPQYELRPLAVPAPAPVAVGTRMGVYDLLLLGTPPPDDAGAG